MEVEDCKTGARPDGGGRVVGGSTDKVGVPCADSAFFNTLPADPQIHAPTG